MRPVLGGLVVAEPLVRELVRDEQPVIPRAIGVRALVRKPVDELRGAHHLLAAEEVGDGLLRVLGPRVAHAGELGVRLDDVGRVAEERARERAVLVIDVVVDGDAAPLIVDARVRRDRDGDEIRGRGPLLAPMRGVRAILVAHIAHEPAVGDDGHARGNRGEQLPALLVVREIVGRGTTRCFPWSRPCSRAAAGGAGGRRRR